MAQALDLVVDGAVLFNIGVGVGDIRLRLVIVIIGHEVFHRVFGEKLLELRAQLGSQRLVVGQHQRGAVDPLDDRGHGKGLAAAGHAQQRLLVQPQLDAAGEHVDGLRLVAGGTIVGNKLEVAHMPGLPNGDTCSL